MSGEPNPSIAVMVMNTSEPSVVSDPNQYSFDNYNQRIAVAVLTIIISVVGILGNSLVLFAVSLSRKLQTKVNVFVVNLSISDSIICLVLPFNVVALLSQSGRPLSSYLCTGTAGLLWTSLGCGTITLAFIALNRYYVVKYHNYDKVYTSRRIAALIAFTWLFPAILMMTVTQAGLGRLGYSSQYRSCTQDTTHPLSEYLSLLAGVIIFLPSLVVIIFSYVMIFVYIWKHNRQTLRIFIVGGADNGAMDYSVSEYPPTPRSPAQVHFSYPPPDGANATSPATNGLTSPTTNGGPSTPSSPQRHTHFDVDVENDRLRNGRRRQSVSEGISNNVSRRQADITRNLFYVVCAFLICLAPYGVSIILPDSEPAIPWVMVLLQLNTCVNPVIYALKHPTFREVIPCILRCDFAKIPGKSAWLRKLLGNN